MTLTINVDDCILINNTLTLFSNNNFDVMDNKKLHYTLGNAILCNQKKKDYHTSKKTFDVLDV